MPMNTSERLDLSREIDQLKEPPGDPGAETWLQEISSNERTRCEDLAGRHVPDEDVFETFVDGAGI
jgi:hypothetical protein